MVGDATRVPAALPQVEFPASREDLVQTAADNEAPAEVINFFKSLPRDSDGSAEDQSKHP